MKDDFEAYHTDFDTAYIARFACADEASAHRTCEQIRFAEFDSYEVVPRYFVAVECSKPPSCDLCAIVQRGYMSPELATALFTATPGEVLEPV